MCSDTARTEIGGAFHANATFACGEDGVNRNALRHPFPWVNLRSATESGVVGKTYPGGVTFVHRFGSSLNLRMHLRMCVLDGVFVECENEAPRFVPARSLSKEELHKIVERVAGRVVKWLRKHGYVGQEDDPGSNETRALTFDEMLAQAASQ